MKEGKDPLLQHVDVFIRKCPIGLKWFKFLKDQRIILVTESTNTAQMLEFTVDDKINVDRLMLDRKDCQRLIEEVDPLIVRQIDLVNSERYRILKYSVDKVHGMNGIILQAILAIRLNGIVISVNLLKCGMMMLIVNIISWAYNQVARILAEKWALPIKLFTSSCHSNSRLEGEERLKQFDPNVFT